jgi:hypothetical protein
MRYSAASSAPDKNLHGINSLYLSFFGDRLWHISVFYPRNEAQEIEPIVTSLNMPNEDRSSAVCQGFKADLDLRSPDWQLSLGDTVAAQKIRALEIREMQKIAAQCQKSLVIRGVRLGMSSTQFKALYPRAKMIRKRTEVGELVYRNVSSQDAGLKAVRTLTSSFLDGKLFYVVIDYATQIEWEGIDQFVEQFTKGTGLPKNWDSYHESRTLQCPSFVVEAEMTAGHPRVAISDRAEVLKLTKREERLKSPSSFRP